MPNRNKTPYEDGISLNVRVLPFLLTSFSRLNPNVRESSPELKVFWQIQTSETSTNRLRKSTFCEFAASGQVTLIVSSSPTMQK